MYVPVWLVLNFVVVFTECLNYTEHKETCNRTFTDDKIVIETPRNESPFWNCFYVLKGHACATFFIFHFVAFNLSDECNLDRLEVSENEVLCGEVSGIKTYFASTGELNLSLITNSGDLNKNVKILIRRLPCYMNDQSTINSDTTLNRQQPDPLPFCCSNNLNSKHFFLSSPNFLYPNRKFADCLYQIQRASTKVCRLRIQFLYFWLGEHLSNDVCNKGYIELDGKFICGCRTGLKLISAFDSINSFKTIRVQNVGFPQTAFSGFVLEVAQDECPERISSTVENPTSENTIFDRFNETITKARLVKEENYFDYLHPEIVKHVYVFEDVGERKDKEKTTYINSFDYEMQLLNDYDVYQCEALGLAQLRMLSARNLWKEITQCDVISEPLTLKCTEANFIRGYIQSPQYPYYYPAGLHVCFRFVPPAGHCGVRIYFLDFDIVRSYECKKDYLLVRDKIRYCGRALHNAGLTLDLRNHSQEMVFVSNGYTCGRGFRAIYEHLPCNNNEFTVSPVYPLGTTPYPTITTPSITSDLHCNKNIQDKQFLLEVYSYNKQRCTFNIFQNNDRVCRLSLKFLEFNVLCEYEYLIIENKIYCGELENDIVNIQFNRYQLPITYVRATATPDLFSLRFRITGLQMTEECDLINIPEVQVERLHLQNASLEENAKSPDLDICGILLNATNDIASKLCNVIQKYDNSTACLSITKTVMYIPKVVFQELKLDLQKNKMMEQLEVQEIPCNNISKILGQDDT